MNGPTKCLITPSLRHSITLSLSLFPMSIGKCSLRDKHNFINPLYKFCFSFFLFFLLGCAAVGPPPGGPVDKTSPSLVSVKPLSGTTHISGGLSVLLVFSERLYETSLDNGINLLPVMKTSVELKIKKEMVTVKLPENLASNQTYILTLTRDILDEHRNRLDRVYQLAFSTGDKISEGVISGRVYGSPEKSSLVYLYQITEEMADSLFLRQPDYVTETDDEGHYSFSYLDPGEYLVIAFTGGRSPFPVVPSRMHYGVHWRSSVAIAANDTTFNINMRIFKEVPPFKVVNIQMENHAQGLIRFTTPVSLSSQNMPILLFSFESEHEVIPDIIYQFKGNSEEIRFQVSNLIPGNKYTTHVSDFRDSTDQELEPMSKEIQVPEMDSLRVSIIFPEIGKTIKLTEGFTPINIQFDGVILSSTDSIVATLEDTGGIELPLILEWENPTRLVLTPGLGWDTDKEYRLNLFANRLFSRDSINMADTVFTYPIKIRLDGGEGGISGKVLGEYVLGSIVEAKPVENSIISYSVVVNSKGEFNFKKLPAEDWILSAFQDSDKNGRYTPGRAIPFIPSEPFLMTQDTIEVRANWDVEGIELTYPDEE
ncbi:MAG: Ig-like domain-containing protein [Candidatus Marinimicrobia bacterium]|nr:Ig-like domain-containing protein [Candidatus Neomarinimicrobiota bacterium]